MRNICNFNVKDKISITTKHLLLLWQQYKHLIIQRNYYTRATNFVSSIKPPPILITALHILDALSNYFWKMLMADLLKNSSNTEKSSSSRYEYSLWTLFAISYNTNIMRHVKRLRQLNHIFFNPVNFDII